MRYKRFHTLPGVGSLASGTVAVGQQQTPPVTFPKIKDNVYSVTGRGRSNDAVGSHNAFVVGNTGVILDAKTSVEVERKVIAEIPKVTPKLITTTILTHSDEDHVGGLAAFAVAWVVGGGCVMLIENFWKCAKAHSRIHCSAMRLFLAICVCLTWASVSYCSDESRALYSELFIYRTKMDNTQNYSRKLWVLIDAGIEHTPEGVVDQRMRDIDGTPSPMDTVASGLSMMPGYLGKIGKAIELYNFGNRESQASEIAGADPAASDEESTRRAINLAYDLVDKDPAFAATINKYLGSTLGPIDGTIDQIEDANPDFKQFKDVQEIKQTLGDQQKAVAEVKTIVDTLKDKLAAQEAAAARAASYQDNQRTIEEWTAYGNVLARVVGFSNPALGRNFGLAVSAYEKGATVLNQMSHGLMSSPAGAANLALIGMDLLSGLTGSSPDAAILESLAQIQKEIQTCTEHILNRLDMIDARLEDMQRVEMVTYDELIHQHDSLDSLHSKVDEMERTLLTKDAFLYNSIRAGFDRDLQNTVASAISYKRLFRPQFQQKNDAEFKQDLVKLYNYATRNAADALATGAPGNRNYDPTGFTSELSQYPDSTNLIYVRNTLQKITNATLPNLSVDVDTWALSATTLYTLISDWPEYQSQLDSRFVGDVIANGRQVIDVSASLSFHNTSSSYVALSEQIAKQTNDYVVGLIKSAADHIRQDVLLKGKVDFPSTPDAVTLASFKGDNLIQILAGAAPQHVSGTINYKAGAGVKPVQFVPQTLQTILPAAAKLAFNLGLAAPDCKIVYSHINQHFDDSMQCEMVAGGSNKRYLVAKAERHVVINYINEECLLGCPSDDATADSVARTLFPTLATDTSQGQNALLTDFRDNFKAYFTGQLNNAKIDYDTSSTTAKNAYLAQLGLRNLLLSAIVLSDPDWLSRSESLTTVISSSDVDLDGLCSGILIEKSATDINSAVSRWQVALLNSLQGLSSNKTPDTAFPEVRDTLLRLGELQTALVSGKAIKSADAYARQIAQGLPQNRVP